MKTLNYWRTNIMASIDFDIDDYIDELSNESLLRELKRRDKLVQNSLNMLDEDTEFPIKINGMDDEIKRDILIKWIERNFKRLSIQDFDEKFDLR